MNIYVIRFQVPMADGSGGMMERVIVVNAHSRKGAEIIVETYYPGSKGEYEFLHSGEQMFCVISSVEVPR